MRRIEAITGPAAIDWFRERVSELRQAGELLGSPQDPVTGARRAAEQLESLSKGAQEAEKGRLADVAKQLAESSVEVGGARLVTGEAPAGRPEAACSLSLTVCASQLGDAAVVLGGAEDGRVGLVACVAPALVERGLSAAEVVREAAALVGGGGGGRDEVAQAGGKDPAKLPEALDVARQAIERKLSG